MTESFVTLADDSLFRCTLLCFSPRGHDGVSPSGQEAHVRHDGLIEVVIGGTHDETFDVHVKQHL